MQRFSQVALHQVLRLASRSPGQAVEAQYAALSLLASSGYLDQTRTQQPTFCWPAFTSHPAVGLQQRGVHSLRDGGCQSLWPKYASALGKPHADQHVRGHADAVPRLQQTQQRSRKRLAQRRRQGAVTQRREGESTDVEHSDSDGVVTADASVASSRQVANIVRHPALVVTRNIEWGTVIFGFEQANQYTILNEDGETVALLAENLGGFGRQIGRQLLRTRRPFTATVFSPDGSQIIFRVRRPFYFINSTILVEDGAGNVVGEVHQRWHLWQRNYDLYAGRRQFAAINGSFLAWEFVLKDQNGGVLALIDRNFQGFGKELFTDAGKYVLHFGEQPAAAAENVANTIQAAHPDKPKPPVTALAKLRTDVSVIPTQSGNQLEVQRSLGLSERMLCLAAAISIDYDYFSRHSSTGGGGLLGPMLMPMPPLPPYPDTEGAPGGEGEPPEGSEAPPGGSEAPPGDSEAPAGSQEPAFPADDEPFSSESGPADMPPEPEPFERDLGGDDFGGDFGDAGGGSEEGASGWDMLKDIFGNDD